MTGVSLDSRERVTLFIESDLSIHYVLGLPLIHYDLVREHCASTDHIRAANLSVTKLRRMGASTPDALKALGFDMYDLRNESWCVQLVNEYGAEAVQQAFLDTPYNVSMIAGVPAMDVLKLTVNWIVSNCKSDPISAQRALRCLIAHRGLETTLTQLSMPSLVETGLRNVELSRLGVTVDVLVSCMHATSDDLRSLHYTFRLQ